MRRLRDELLKVARSEEPRVRLAASLALLYGEPAPQGESMLGLLLAARVLARAAARLVGQEPAPSAQFSAQVLRLLAPREEQEPGTEQALR